ncbi:MAG: acyl-CoA dehydrogenase family protein [Gemmatimonadales bacterium]
MTWDFETDPEYQKKLDFAAELMRDEIEPLDLVLRNPYDKTDTRAQALVRPLQERVREEGLWACHLGPELGGQGYGQLKLALLNEIIGSSKWAPTVFGCQAPDSGNAEIIAHFGTPSQREKYLQPLLDGEISSSYAMTELHAGADPTLFTTRARRDGDEWVIDGEKWFASNARHASFYVLMAVSDPDVSAYQGMSMFLVPAETPGITIVRNIGTGTEKPGGGSHGYLRFEGVRVPSDNLLGQEGGAFAIAQTRLGGGRVHHAMRTISQLRKAFDMMCERALSRKVRGGELLASMQMTQEKIADSWIEIEQFRLLVLRTAWLIDKHKDYRKVRKDIAAVKVAMPKVLHDVVQRAMHLHGALGVSNEMPFSGMLIASEIMGIADGPTEVHQQTVARQLLKGYQGVDGPWPSAHLPTRREQAEAHLAALLEHELAND